MLRERSDGLGFVFLEGYGRIGRVLCELGYGFAASWVPGIGGERLREARARDQVAETWW
jgi:hypothetical protein